MNKNAPKPMIVSLAAGQVLSVISIDPAAGEAAEQARQDYLDQAFPLAGQYGLKPLGSLNVAHNPVGKFSPGAVSFFSWPNSDDAAAFASDPSWAPIKATRPAGWDELRVHDVVVDQDLALRFEPGKIYTMATAWINPKKPLDYDHYLAGIADTVTASGGRFILDMRDLAFEAHANVGPPPGRVIFVEWNSAQGLAEFQKTSGFRAHVHYLNSGTTRFELLMLNRGE